MLEWQYSHLIDLQEFNTCWHQMISRPDDASVKRCDALPLQPTKSKWLDLSLSVGLKQRFCERHKSFWRHDHHTMYTFYCTREGICQCMIGDCRCHGYAHATVSQWSCWLHCVTWSLQSTLIISLAWQFYFEYFEVVE